MFWSFLLASAFALTPEEAVDTYFSDLAVQGRFSGVVRVIPEGEPAFDVTVGTRDGPKSPELDGTEAFHIGSLTKQFTAAAILVLVEQGKLKLTDPVSTYIPEYSPEALSQVTIHQLLTHTSGLRFQPVAYPWGPEPDTEQLMEAMLSTLEPPESPAPFAYSNDGYMILGEVIRRLTSTSYEQALRDLFFDQMEMDNTRIHLEGASSTPQARGHIAILAKDRIDLQVAQELFPWFIPYDHSWDAGSDGAMWSTLDDLTVWVEALRKGEVLDSPSMEALWTPKEDDYALGWVVTEDRIWHNGALTPLGYTSYIGWDTMTRDTVLILSNTDISAAGDAALHGDKVFEILRDGEGADLALPPSPFLDDPSATVFAVGGWFSQHRIHWWLASLIGLVTAIRLGISRPPERSAPARWFGVPRDWTNLSLDGLSAAIAITFFLSLTSTALGAIGFLLSAAIFGALLPFRQTLPALPSSFWGWPGLLGRGVAAVAFLLLTIFVLQTRTQILEQSLVLP